MLAKRLAATLQGVLLLSILGCGEQPELSEPVGAVPADAALALHGTRVVAAVNSGGDIRLGRLVGLDFDETGKLDSGDPALGVALVASTEAVWVAETRCEGVLEGLDDDQRCSGHQYVQISRTDDGGESAEAVFDSRKSGLTGLGAPRVSGKMWLSRSSVVAVLSDDTSSRSALVSIDGSSATLLGSFERLRSACAARSGIYVVEASPSDEFQRMVDVRLEFWDSGDWREIPQPKYAEPPFDVQLGCTRESGVLVASERGRVELFDLRNGGEVGAATQLEGAVTLIEGPVTGVVGLRSVSLSDGSDLQSTAWAYSADRLSKVVTNPPIQPEEHIVLLDADADGIVTRVLVQPVESMGLRAKDPVGP
ncbi:MAG: hypothetical protein IT195_10575 [Microthrixaceae bacterium]|nr:hypothetical protein [Microthrixaceae bacterium]